MNAKAFSILAASVLLGCSTLTFAQANPGGGGGGGGGGGNGGGGRQRGNFDPAQMQQRMMDMIKTQLGSTDEEFTALQPKITAVIAAQREAGAGGMGGRGGGMGRGGGGGGGGGGAPQGEQSAVQVAQAALRETLGNKDAPADEIKAKLDAFRAAKAAAKEKLVAAQKDLKELVTPRQEAVLVMFGMLE
jgi:Spy/CpxP family protein refolding chaperone